MAKQIKWLSSTTCDLCGEKCVGTLYDAIANLYGQWGTMCKKCFDAHSPLDDFSLGLGRGQKYEQNANGEFVKVKG